MSVSSDRQERSCFMVETSKLAYVCASDFAPGTHVNAVHNAMHVPRTLSAKVGKDSSESSDTVKLVKFNKPEDFFDWHEQAKAYATV